MTEPTASPETPPTHSLGAPSARVVQSLLGLAIVGVCLHLLGRLWLLEEGRYFASEDDGYRAYYGHLAADASVSVIGRFWLPGQFFVLGALGRLGLDAAQAPLALGALSVVVLAVSLRSLAKDLAPAGWGDAAGWGCVALVTLSPLVLVLSHSALAECPGNALAAFAASALARRHHGGARRLVASGALAMLLATWFRYEIWLLALAYVVAAAALARRAGWRAAAIEGGVAALALVGPLGWLLAQYLKFDDPLAFLDTVDEMSIALAGAPSPGAVARARLEALALWVPVPIVLAMLAGLRGHAALRVAPGLAVVAALALPGLALEIASGRGLGVLVVGGRAVEFFAPRLVSIVEIALVPLAGLGLALGVAAAATRVEARAGLAALTVLAVMIVARGLVRAPSFVDPSSVRLGVMLRRGELDGALAGGDLLVERVEPRPPMGWASLSVLWSRWDRTTFYTRRGALCLLVEAHDVAGARHRIPCAELAVWARAHDVRAAWALSEPARALFDEQWPEGERRRIGDGVLVLLP